MATTTVNISLPTNLKKEADFLVARGDFASFSDFMRTSARELLERKYQRWTDNALRDIKSGKAVALDSDKDIADFVNKHMK